MSNVKNGWKNNLTESWKHLASDAKNVDVSSFSTSYPNSPHEFQQASNWCSLQSAEFPLFTIDNMMNYFIKRKSGDNEGNKDYKNLKSKAFGLFKHGHVQNIEVDIGESGQVIYIRCGCLPEMKKNLKYKLNVTMINSGEQAGEITNACCSPCPAGKGPFASCKHLAALCFALEEFVRLKQNESRKRKLELRSVYEIDFSKKIYGRENAGDSKIFHDPRLPVYRDNEKANQNMLDNIREANLECGFCNILSHDKHPSKVLMETTTTSANIVSPPKEQLISLHEIHERANIIKTKLFVNANERKRIKEATKQQSGSQKWFEVRKIRITASKCKRAIQRPTSSPTKAIIDILYLKDNFQGQQMQ